MPNGDQKNREAGGGNKWAVMGGIALNVEYTRKYGFEATAAARVTAKLVAIPPPNAFQEAVQADIVGRAERAAALVAPPTGPGLSPPQVPPVTLPPASPAGGGEELRPLSLIVEEKAGLQYTLDDGVMGISEGQVDEGGMLNHPVSVRSTGCVITFADGSDPIELRFDQAEVDEDEEGEDSDSIDEQDIEPEDEDIAEELETLSDQEEDEPVLSLIIPEKAGKAYTLDDGLSPPTDGVIDEDGFLAHPVTYGATNARITFKDKSEPIEVEIA